MQLESLAYEATAPRISRRLLSLLGWVALGALLGALLLLRPPCPDLATFDYAGWVLSAGGTLYVDVVEQNWPGAIWLHALAVSLFGNQLWSFRVVDGALLMLGSFALSQLAALGGRRATRWIVLALYPALYVSADDWMIGQRDMLATHVLLALAWAYARRWSGGPLGLVVAVGAGTALVMLTRPTYLVFLPLLLLAERSVAAHHQRSWRASMRDACLAAAVLASMVGAVVLHAWWTGALVGWYEATVLFNTRLYSHTASLREMFRLPLEGVRGYGWVGALMFVGLLAWVRRGERSVLALIACIALTGVASFFAQGKGFGYHLAAVCPAAALFAAECIAWSLDLARTRRRALAGALAAAVCLLALVGTAKKLHRVLGPQLAYLTGRAGADEMARRVDIGMEVSRLEIERVARYVREHTRPDQTVLVWGRAVLVNYLAERRLPTPLATVGVLDTIGAPGAPLHRIFVDFERTLREAPPALLVAYNERLASEHRALWDAGPEAPASARVRELLTTRYRLAERIGPLDVFALRGADERVPTASRAGS